MPAMNDRTTARRASLSTALSTALSIARATAPSLGRSPWAAGLALACLFASAPSWALYKVVGPDGKVTYTDRPPAASNDKVTGISNTGAVSTVGSPAPTLPLALRQVAERFPVVFYVSSSDCETCNAARQFLKQRGIPATERSVTTAEDVEALQKLTAGRELPALSVGAQVLRGFSTSEWTQYLDAAGYPAKSALPPDYKAAEATPLAPRRGSAPAADSARSGAPGTSPATPPAAAPSPSPAPEQAPAAANPASGIRF